MEARRFILLYQCRSVTQALSAGAGHAASLQLAISVTGSPTSAAMLSAQVATFSALSSLLLSPSGATLSDRVGRKPCMVLGGLLNTSSGIVWRMLEFVWCAWQPSPRCFMLASCVLSAVSAASGGSLAELASLDDMLATQPAVLAAVASRIGFWSGTAGLAGTMGGARLLAQHGNRGSSSAVRLCVSLALILQLCGLLLTCCIRETRLAPAREQGNAKDSAWVRRPTNPLINMGLMLRHGSRLRRLMLANLLFQVLNGNNALISTFALDQLKWAPADLSHFSAFQSASDMVAQGLVLPALLLRRTHTPPDTGDTDSKPKATDVSCGGCHRATVEGQQKRNMQRAFFVGSLGSILSCLLMSQCWRPSGGRHWHSAILMVVAEALRAGIGRACIVTMRTMLLSTALQDCPSGTGVAELNAALLGMKTLCAGTGMGWVAMYQWFNVRGNPGGTWLLAAAGRCVVHVLVATCSFH